MFYQRALSTSLLVCLVLTWGCDVDNDQAANSAAPDAVGPSTTLTDGDSPTPAPAEAPAATGTETPPAAQGTQDETPTTDLSNATGAEANDTSESANGEGESPHNIHEGEGDNIDTGASDPSGHPNAGEHDGVDDTPPGDTDAPDESADEDNNHLSDGNAEHNHDESHNSDVADGDPEGEESLPDDETQDTTDDLPEDTNVNAEGENPTTVDSQPETEREALDDETLFQDLRTNHWRNIFPNGRRNVGGPQFFKYIYESLATNHDLFARYNQFYCGVSGSVVRPRASGNFDYIKVKDSTGACVVGKYYRCCWPCLCDIMKYGQVEPVQITLPLDPTNEERTYFVLTVGDPCHECNTSPCANLPPQVQAYNCEEGATSNGLRVLDGRLTTAAQGRLILAMLHEAEVGGDSDQIVRTDLLDRCTERIEASVEDLSRMGGMGNIFVNLALINNEQTYTNSFSDLCE